MLAAAVALGSPASTTIDEEVNAARRTTRSGYSKRCALVFPAVAIIAVLSFYMSWETAGRFFFANNAGSVLHGTGNPSYADVDARFEQATNLAPEVARYWHDRSDLEHGKADANTNPAIILEARQLACEYDKKAFDANPLELTNHYRLAFSAWELGKLWDDENQIEAVEPYVRLTGLAPADGLAAERLETLRNVLNP